VLDGILGREHQERLLQRESRSSDRDLLLLHRLEQRGLDLGRRAVDLVGQDDLGKERTALDLEFLGLGIEDHGADDVGRQQVRRKLNARERRVNDFRERPHRERLRQSWYSLDQDVTAGEESHQQPLDHDILSYDALGDFSGDAANWAGINRAGGRRGFGRHGFRGASPIAE
jgi:hypothetical protein